MSLKIGQVFVLHLNYNCIYYTVYLIKEITLLLYVIPDSVQSSDLFYVSPDLHSTE